MHSYHTSMTRPAQPWLLSHNNGLKFSFIVSTYYNSSKSELFELSDCSMTPSKSLLALHLSSVLCFLHSTVPTCFWKYLTRMALPIDYLWKGLKKLESQHQGQKEKLLAELLRYCRNVRPTWVKFNSKDTKESEWCSKF